MTIFHLSVQPAVVEAGHSSLGGDNLVGVRDGFQKDLSLLCFPSLRCENSGTVPLSLLLWTSTVTARAVQRF